MVCLSNRRSLFVFASGICSMPKFALDTKLTSSLNMWRSEYIVAEVLIPSGIELFLIETPKMQSARCSPASKSLRQADISRHHHPTTEALQERKGHPSQPPTKSTTHPTFAADPSQCHRRYKITYQHEPRGFLHAGTRSGPPNPSYRMVHSRLHRVRA